jgi:tetratricopeptide (TPR) repeat protein
MFRDNAIFGVGADNFGVNVTEARRAYRLENPENPPTEIAEDYLIERTHNEYLQILAELGIVGFTLFCIPFVIFKLQLLQYLRRRRLSIRPFVAAAISGMSAFAISSLVSSFSFRSVQNGVVFFIVFGLLAHRTAGRNQRSWKIPAFVLPAVIAGSSLLLFAFSIRLAAAEYYVYRAERSDAAGSEPLFQKALYLDADYAGANYLLAGRQAAVGNFESAIDNFSASIDRGIATSDTFVRLAKAQAATGNIEEATKTFEHGLEVYPRSIYLRTAFVVFLEKNGRKDQAEEQARKALSIDGPQARGWLLLFREGGNNAFRAAQKDPGIAEPDELRPASAVPQYLDAIPYQ